MLLVDAPPLASTCAPLPLAALLAPPGATALDKKSRKKFEAERLAQIGAKAESKPRMAASIGHGMAKKQAQRAERALQEGIAGAPGCMCRRRSAGCGGEAALHTLAAREAQRASRQLLGHG